MTNTKLTGTILLTLTLLGCGAPPPDQPDRGDTVEESKHGLASLGMDRVIPIRFVQIAASSSSFMSDAQIRTQIEGANSVYKAAGVQFKIGGEHNVVDSLLANPSTAPSSVYTWPNPVSSAKPIIYNPNCSFAHPVNESPVVNALWRSAFLCGYDGEILVFVLDNYVTNTGAFPSNGRGVMMIRSSMTGSNSYIFAHELGHYLGLTHSFDGVLGDPEQGVVSLQSSAWDLVYLPRSVASPYSAANKVFDTRAEAAQYEGQLQAIKLANSANCVFCNPTQPGNPCPSTHPEGALKCTVSTGLSSPATETWYTGERRMRGIGFTIAAPSPRTGTELAFNVMDYPPAITQTPSHDYLFSISEAQAEQIRRYLRFEVMVSHPDPTLSNFPSGRPRLGLSSATPRLTERMNIDNVGGRDLMIYEPTTKQFRVKPSGSTNAYSGSTITVGFGGAGDIPMPGDYDGDGKADYAVRTFATSSGSVSDSILRWCPSSVTVNQGSNKCSHVEKMRYGLRDDVTISDVNFDGDSSTPEVAAYRPSTSEWFWASIPKPSASAASGEVTISATSVGSVVYPGGPTAEPIVGLYDGDNKTDIALFDGPSHLFAMRLSTESYQTLRVINLPAPAANSWPLALRGMKRSATQLALAAFYPDGNVRIVWNPAALPASWTWGGGAGAVTTSCATVASTAVPVSGSIDFNNDGISDIVQYHANGDGLSGMFYIRPIGTAFTCQPTVSIAVTGAGDAMKLIPFVVGDMKGDGRNELGVVNPDTQSWKFYPSDGAAYTTGNSFTIQHGTRDAQPL